MENNEENKIQDAQVVPEARLEEIVKEASVTTSQTEAEEMPKEVLADISGNEAEEARPETTPVSDIDDSQEKAVAEKIKSEYRSRLILIFVLGFLIGIALKTEALKRITIGYDDYLMKIKSQSYDINDIQAKLQKEIEAATQVQEQEGDATDSGNVPVSSGEQNTQEGLTDQAGN
jgi:hypothetical protein